MIYTNEFLSKRIIKDCTQYKSPWPWLPLQLQSTFTFCFIQPASVWSFSSIHCFFLFWEKNRDIKKLSKYLRKCVKQIHQQKTFQILNIIYMSYWENCKKFNWVFLMQSRDDKKKCFPKLISSIIRNAMKSRYVHSLE